MGSAQPLCNFFQLFWIVFRGHDLHDCGGGNLTRGEQLLDDSCIEFSRRQKLGCCLDQLRGSTRSLTVGRSIINSNDQHIAARVINGDILARLKEAELADALSGDARSGEVGDASRLEFDAHVGDVNLWGEDGQADSADLANWRGGESEHDIKIVNHEVEDHVDVERTRREDGEPVRLKKHGPPDFWLDGKDGGIEALEMAGLQDALAFLRAGDEIVGLRKAGGERLFDEEIESGIEQCRGHCMMMNRGHGDGCSVEVKVGGEQLLDGGEDRDRVFGFGVGGSSGVGIDGGYESNTETGGFKFAIDAQMVASKGAGTGNGDPQDGSACYFAASLPSTALRQRP